MLNKILEAAEEKKSSLILYIIINYEWESQTLFSEHEKE